MEEKLQQIIDKLDRMIQQNEEGLTLCRMATLENEKWKEEIRGQWHLEELTHALSDVVNTLKTLRGTEAPK